MTYFIRMRVFSMTLNEMSMQSKISEREMLPIKDPFET